MSSNPDRARALSDQIVHDNPDLAAPLFELLGIVTNPRGKEERDRIAWATMRHIYNSTEDCDEGFKQDLDRVLGAPYQSSELSS